MKTTMNNLARAAACSAIALASAFAAADEQTVVQSTDYGMPDLPFSKGFNLTLAQMPSGDTFLSDYGFSIGSAGSFSSAVVTFDLSSVFQISGLTVTLYNGTAWSGAVPTDLSPAQIAARNAGLIVTGSGMPTAQTIDQMTLGPGNYLVEVSGNVIGTSGGSFGGLLNVAAVPEPAGFALALAGFGLLAFARRRGTR